MILKRLAQAVTAKYSVTTPVLLASLCLSSSLLAAPLPPDDVNAVYVGHSLINHDMPAMVKQLVASGENLSIEYANQMILGSPLLFNWNNCLAATASADPLPAQFACDAIAQGSTNGPYDMLIMTEANNPIRGHHTINETQVYIDRFFEVAFTVTDSHGKSDPSPAINRISVTDPNAPTEPNQAPDGQITLPLQPLTLTMGQSSLFTADGSDPDGDTNLSYQWDFGGGAAAQSGAGLEPVVFNQAGSFIVTMAVTDSEGLVDPTPATVQVQRRIRQGWYSDADPVKHCINLDGSRDNSCAWRDWDVQWTYSYSFGFADAIDVYVRDVSIAGNAYDSWPLFPADEAAYQENPNFVYYAPKTSFIIETRFYHPTVGWLNDQESFEVYCDNQRAWQHWSGQTTCPGLN